jgi:hypothetical protein
MSEYHEGMEIRERELLGRRFDRIRQVVDFARPRVPEPTAHQQRVFDELDRLTQTLRSHLNELRRAEKEAAKKSADGET